MANEVIFIICAVVGSILFAIIVDREELYWAYLKAKAWEDYNRVREERLAKHRRKWLKVQRRLDAGLEGDDDSRDHEL